MGSGFVFRIRFFATVLLAAWPARFLVIWSLCGDAFVSRWRLPKFANVNLQDVTPRLAWMRRALIVLFCSFPYVAVAESVSNGSYPDPVTIMFWSRSAERLLIAVIAGVCLYFGYRLMALHHEHRGKLEASVLGQLKIKASQLAPGVFFALFGALTLIYLVRTAPEYENAQALSDGAISKTTVRGAIPGAAFRAPRDQRALQIASVNTIDVYCEASHSSMMTDQRKTQLSKAVANLSSIKEDLIDQDFGIGAYATWKQLATFKLSDPLEFSKRAPPNSKTRRDFDMVDKVASALVGD
jgi:hypothetical protein